MIKVKVTSLKSLIPNKLMNNLYHQ